MTKKTKLWRVVFRQIIRWCRQWWGMNSELDTFVIVVEAVHHGEKYRYEIYRED